MNGIGWRPASAWRPLSATAMRVALGRTAHPYRAPITLMVFGVLLLAFSAVWVDAERAKVVAFWNHRTAVARACLDNGGDWKPDGRCGVPEVTFSILPYKALPDVPEAPPGSNVLPVPPQAPEGRSL